MSNNILDILEYFPNRIKEILIKYESILNRTQEIHIYTNRNILLRTSLEEIKVDYVINTNEILEIYKELVEI